MEVYVILIEEKGEEHEVGPQFFTEDKAKAYLERLRKEAPTKSIWMEKRVASPRPSIPFRSKL